MYLISSVPLFTGFIKKSIAFDEVMVNGYGMIATADSVVAPHRHVGTTQWSPVLGGSGEPNLQRVTVTPLLPEGSHMAHRGNSFPFALPLDLNGSLLVWYTVNTVEKHIFSASFNNSQAICFTLEKTEYWNF